MQDYNKTNLTTPEIRQWLTSIGIDDKEFVQWFEKAMPYAQKRVREEACRVKLGALDYIELLTMGNN